MTIDARLTFRITYGEAHVLAGIAEQPKRVGTVNQVQGVLAITSERKLLITQQVVKNAS